MEPPPPPAPRSPRRVALAAPDADPTPEQLHGKRWHHGDPHSQYRFLRVLGTGHYGVTYLATSLASGEQVAIKALDKGHPEYERERCVEEILILAAVSDHPNVAALAEVWEDAGHVFVAMEACLGGELFDAVIQRKRFSEGEAASLAAAVLSVIQHCHSKGIIHRDLKPENFLLQREGDLSAGNLRAVDFGLSKFAGADAICRSCVGSSYYIAPEVLRGAYSYEADAWSVGTIVYIMLSGFPPFWGSSDPVVFHRILNKPVDFEYQPWPALSAAAKDFVARLLDKDPARRATAAQALTHPWITAEASDVPLSADIISRLQSFTHQNRVKCLLMTVAARHLGADEIGGLRKIFSFVDADHDGEISLHDLTVALQHTGLDMEQAVIVSLLAGLDLANHGTVHVEEFIAAALDQRKVLTAQTVAEIFKQLDSDHDGLLSVGELRDALEECQISIKADTLGRLMEREGALDCRGMVSAKSFQSLLLMGEAAEPKELEAWARDVQHFGATAGPFRQLAMLVVARLTAPGEVESLRCLFQRLDPDATGAVSLAQLREAVRHIRGADGEGEGEGEGELAGELLEALDVRHRGVIDYNSFLAACLKESHLTEGKLRAAFDYFDQGNTGSIEFSDVQQVLQDVGMDTGLADKVMCAASADGSASATDASPPSTRSVSYEDFRRLVLAQPPGVVTKALSRTGSLVLGEAVAVATSAAPNGVPRSGSFQRSPDKAANGSKPPLSPGWQSSSPGGSAGSPAATCSGATANQLWYAAPGPPSPISLLPRPYPTSPGGGLGLQPRQPLTGSPPAQRHLRRFGFLDPPSPINLMPRADEQPSPLDCGCGGPATTTSPLGGSRPYSSLMANLGSPLAISLAPRPLPLSPGSVGAAGSSEASPSRANGGGSGGMTLHQMLQQYSSSGYSWGISRRASVEVPFASLEATGDPTSLARSSDVSDPDDSWLGGN